MLVQLTSDARNGIGITKNVLNALPDGLSTLLESAHQSMTTAQPGITTEFVLLVIPVTLLIMENVKFQMFSVNLLLLMVAAFLVIMVMFYTTSNAFPSLN